MKYFIQMQQNKWKLKAMFYGTIAALMENQKEIVTLLQNSYAALKDVPIEELQTALIDKLAELIHKEKDSKDI